jgi:hypothetical protein
MHTTHPVWRSARHPSYRGDQEAADACENCVKQDPDPLYKRGGARSATGCVVRMSTNLGDTTGCVVRMSTNLGSATGCVVRMSTNLGNATGYVVRMLPNLSEPTVELLPNAQELMILDCQFPPIRIFFYKLNTPFEIFHSNRTIGLKSR